MLRTVYKFLDIRQDTRLETWVHILRSITQSNIGNYFEYMWAALLITKCRPCDMLKYHPSAEGASYRHSIVQNDDRV